MNLDDDNLNNREKNITKSVDDLIGKKIALASNSIVPIVAPTLVDILWKNKNKFIIFIIVITLFFCLGFQSLVYQYTVTARNLWNEIPPDQINCIQNASKKYNLESELLASFGYAISSFDIKHKGNGSGFLEIPQSVWKDYGIDQKGNKTTDPSVLCNNYFTLANKLKDLNGISIQRIDQYESEILPLNSSQKDSIEKAYNLFIGSVDIPYGNPIGLDKSDLAIVTSGYGLTRVVDGVVNVHTGIDFVPSTKWFQENPGKGTTDAIDKSIVEGKVSEFKDSYEALCVYVTNNIYRTLYCHCREFLAQNGSEVKYGDPICILGNTGFSTGPHVHVEVHKKQSNGKWEILDPTPFTIPQNSIQNPNI